MTRNGNADRQTAYVQKGSSTEGKAEGGMRREKGRS